LPARAQQAHGGGGRKKEKRADIGDVAEEMREEMMRTRLAISAVVLVLSAGVSVQTATACSKEAVAGAVDRWSTVLAENNPDTIVALYSKDAVLWGSVVGHAFVHGSIRSCRAEGVLRGGLPSAAETHRQIRRAVYPRIWRYRYQHGLLHTILHQGRRNQINPRPLQFHIREGGQRL
jgi:hypothetical protein